MSGWTDTKGAIAIGSREETRVPFRTVPLWWQKQGLSFTVSGYGRRIPTSIMVQLPGSPRWRRVYCCSYGNGGTCYVDGPKGPDGKRPWIVITD